MKHFKTIWILSLLIKLAFATLLPITNDEAYYWVWSQNLQLSYFDHPAFVGWLMWLGHPFEFLGNSVRWPAVLLGHFTILVWYFIWRDFLSSNKEKFSWWLSLSLLTPLIGFGSIIVTPDLPVVFFWSCSLYFLLQCLTKNLSRYYMLLGASLGLGFCSKYHIVIFGIIGFLYMTIEKKWKQISIYHFLLTLSFGFLFSLPVLIWNYQNNFISFQFQINRGLNRLDYEAYWTWSYLLAQLVLISPLLVWTSLKVKMDEQAKFFAYFGLGPILFFLLTSFRGLVEVNWPLMAYPSIFVLGVLGARTVRPILVTCLIWTTFVIIIGSHLVKPWLPQVPDRIQEFSQFEAALPMVSKYDPLYGNSYQMSSWLWYQSKRPIYKLKGISRVDYFDSFQQAEPTTFPFYVISWKDQNLPSWVYERNFKVTVVEEIDSSYSLYRVDKI